MSDPIEHFMKTQKPTADRPLQGLTVLVVEDSRFASEAIRLLSLRSGARIRRADSLSAARRHLRAYRPAIVVVDLGLPDGSGIDLIKDLAGDSVPVPVLLGMSGDDASSEASIAAGADGFLAKPVESLAVFQQTILSLLPQSIPAPGLRSVPHDVISPDRTSFQDDLSHVAALLRDPVDEPTKDYIAQFLSMLACSARDKRLETAASRLTQARTKGQGARAELHHIENLVNDRLAEGRAVGDL